MAPISFPLQSRSRRLENTFERALEQFSVYVAVIVLEQARIAICRWVCAARRGAAGPRRTAVASAAASAETSDTLRAQNPNTTCTDFIFASLILDSTI